jgi:hypothetical protein
MSIVEAIERGPAGQEVWDAVSRRPTILVPFSGLTATLKLARGPLIVCGWAVADNAQGAGGFTLYDGDDNTGTRIGDVSWAAAGSSFAGPGADGPFCRVGLVIVRTVGTLNGSLWVKL